jgi:hypothetical protein
MLDRLTARILRSECGQAKHATSAQLGRFENGARSAEFYSAGLNVSTSFNKNTAHTRVLVSQPCLEHATYTRNRAALIA